MNEEISDRQLKYVVEYDPDAVVDKLLETHGSDLLIRKLIEWTSLPEFLEHIALDCTDQEDRADTWMRGYWGVARYHVNGTVKALDDYWAEHSEPDDGDE